MQLQKNKLSGRTVYVIALAVLLILATLVVFISARRNEKNTERPPVVTDERNEVTQKVPDTTRIPPVTTAPKDTSPPVTTSAPTAAEPADVPPENFVAPAHGTLSKSHSTEVLVYSLTMNDYRTHTGIDIAATVGSAVFAAADGKVKEIWEDPLMGHCMSIEHRGGMMTVYKNLSPDIPTGVTPGASVSEGQIIAAVGESAIIESADEPHLHFEVFLNGKMSDPAEYLKALKK
ncbi:MAG: M23 family metallopeptidase [Clostridia bacterium]|nr:M23 family metallopeptidase [Clostridia bacterium]